MLPNLQAPTTSCNLLPKITSIVPPISGPFHGRITFIRTAMNSYCMSRFSCTFDVMPTCRAHGTELMFVEYDSDKVQGSRIFDVPLPSRALFVD